MTSGTGLVERDARLIWHPFTQHGSDPEPLAVVAAQGATLELDDGRLLIDGISSWFCCLHGHGRRELIDAMSRQARQLDHVLFAGATHEPAVSLAERLVDILPPGLERVFYSDNGSTAVEVAIKMVRQLWVHRGQDARRIFVALKGSYHGDTFGAMAVGDPDPFFKPFQPMLFEVERVPIDRSSLGAMLARLADRVAGVIVEPLVQGASGMRMYEVDVLQSIRRECDRFGLPLIVDEVMTGFGRTGSMFACDRAGVSPDLICLSKGLTGGMLPLAATVVRDEIYQAFVSDDRKRAFFHGHTFTANPIACAVALASIDLAFEESVPERLAALGERIEAALGGIAGVRRMGGIVALDVPDEGDYLSDSGPRMRLEAARSGVFLRPLGSVVYSMPPACTTDAQCDQIADVMAHLAGAG